MAKLGASKSVVKIKNPEKTLLSKIKLRDDANFVVGMSCVKSEEWATQNYNRHCQEEENQYGCCRRRQCMLFRMNLIIFQ
jgi:hypothetical protein